MFRVEIRKAGTLFEKHPALVTVVLVASGTHIRLGLLPPYHVCREALLAAHTSTLIELALAYYAVAIATVKANVQPEVLIYEAL